MHERSAENKSAKISGKIKNTLHLSSWPNLSCYIENKDDFSNDAPADDDNFTEQKRKKNKNKKHLSILYSFQNYCRKLVLIQLALSSF